MRKVVRLYGPVEPIMRQARHVKNKPCALKWVRKATDLSKHFCSGKLQRELYFQRAGAGRRSLVPPHRSTARRAWKTAEACHAASVREFLQVAAPYRGLRACRK
jgi:hypothetical protein